MADCAQSSTQALQCQHSSGYLTSGETPFPMALKTCVGQMSAQVPQALHFFLSRMGGIVTSSFESRLFQNLELFSLTTRFARGRKDTEESLMQALTGYGETAISGHPISLRDKGIGYTTR
jgi:hypothetical protein